MDDGLKVSAGAYWLIANIMEIWQLTDYIDRIVGGAGDGIFDKVIDRDDIAVDSVSGGGVYGVINNIIDVFIDSDDVAVDSVNGGVVHGVSDNILIW